MGSDLILNWTGRVRVMMRTVRNLSGFSDQRFCASRPFDFSSNVSEDDREEGQSPESAHDLSKVRAPSLSKGIFHRLA